MTLGELIDALGKCRPEATVLIDLLYLVPRDFNSYRGFYDQLALGFSTENYSGPQVCHLLERAKLALETTYEGYKGGLYRMTRSTPLWLANWGQTTTHQIAGIDDGHDLVMLTTERW